MRGNETGAQGDVDFAARVRVGAGAKAAQQPCNRESRVGFEGVVQRVRIAGERCRDRPEALRDDGGAVDVERGAFRCGNVSKGHLVTDERASLSMESGGRHDESVNLI